MSPHPSTVRSAERHGQWQEKHFSTRSCHHGGVLRSVAVIAQGPVAAFELGVLVEVFGIDRSAEGVPVFDFRLCAATDAAQELAVPGVRLEGLRPLGEALDADLVAVPSSSLTHSPADAVLDTLRRAHAQGAYVLSLCSGTFALAWAGLLDGRRAATHWRYAEDLQARFPAVRVDEEVLYAAQDKVVTGAGTAAGIDACLHLVRRELGSEVAARIARRMVVAPHREGGQKQFIDRPVPAGSGLQHLLEHLSATLERPHTVASMARRARMSPRTLARQFQAQTGTTPHAWLTAQRVLAARRSLEATDAPLDQVARDVGFGDAALLRHHFVQATGVTPSAYRRAFTVRGAPAPPPDEARAPRLPGGSPA